jgi:uncharacterized membrane protein
MKEVCVLFLLFMMYSFLGWSLEVICKLIEKKKFINRGFLVGPVCPIYGVGAVSITILLDKYKDDILVLFIMAMLIASILEYFTSFIMEKLFNARWWDYSTRRFNINGRICLETLIPFGLLGLLITYVVNPFFYSLITDLSTNGMYILSIILFIIFITDLIVSYKVINNVKHTINKYELDNTLEISTKVRNILLKRGILYRRIVKAFPNIYQTKEYWIKRREYINNKIENLQKKLQNRKK